MIVLTNIGKTMAKKFYKTLIEDLQQKLTTSNISLDELADVLSRGYFPAKLPPCFTTEMFGQFARTYCDDLLDTISNKKENEILTKPTLYYLARHNQIRRILAVLNPMSYFLIACVFCAYKDEILKQAQSNFSLSSPKKEIDTSPNTRSYTQNVAWENSDIVKLENRAGKLILLETDISRFYPSIYTHIIPWVLDGKETAKKCRNDAKKLGNILDRVFEWAQDGQTFGLPIGPDITFIIAEMILAHIDNLIDAAMKKNNCSDVCWIRRVDDCEFACNNKEQANKVLSIVQSTLNNFELELNTHKTKLTYLPTSITNDQIQNICEYELKSNETDRKRILNYFNIAFDSFNHNTKGALKYAVKSIKLENLRGTYQELFINFICQCIVLEEGVVESALLKLSSLMKNKELNDKSIEKIKQSLYATIKNHSERKHTSEVVWALWGLFLLEEHLDENITRQLCNMEDSFVYLMLIDLANKSFIKKTIIEQEIATFLEKDTDKLTGKNWLIFYEIIHNNYIDAEKYNKYLEQDEFFQLLHNNGISFYQSKDSVEENIALFEDWLEDNYGCSSYSTEQQNLMDELLYKE